MDVDMSSTEKSVEEGRNPSKPASSSELNLVAQLAGNAKAARHDIGISQINDGIPTGVIPPHLLEDLAKRDPANRIHQETLNQMKDLSWWPFPWGKKSNGEREVYDAKEKYSHPGTRARFEGDAASGNEEVDNAYDYTGQVRDFYKDLFKRNSIDGKGMKYISTVNYGKSYENAFWNGKQMTYGKPGPDSPFKTFVLLDICGHEITHGITEKEAATKYYGQSGALNESYSDVFGELIQQRANKTLAKDADWVVGNGIWKDHVQGRGLRDMLNPGTAYDDPKVGKDPQPAHMKDYKKMSGDNGGVHYNSGIPNRAFALFAINAGGYAFEKPGEIWYAARKAAGSNPSFAQFAHHTIEEAKKLGHSGLVPTLEKAWQDVGVKPSATAKDTDTPVRLKLKADKKAG